MDIQEFASKFNVKDEEELTEYLLSKFGVKDKDELKKYENDENYKKICESNELARRLRDGIARRLTSNEVREKGLNGDCDHLYVLLSDVTVGFGYGSTRLRENIPLKKEALVCKKIILGTHSLSLDYCPMVHPEMQKIDYISCCVRNKSDVEPQEPAQLQFQKK